MDFNRQGVYGWRVMSHEEAALFELVIHRLNHIEHTLRLMATALDTLTASVNNEAAAITALQTAVDTAIADIGSPAATDAQLLTLASTIDGLTSAINAQVTRLNAATAPPPPPTPAPTP